MSSAFRPLTPPFPPAAIESLKSLTLRLSELEAFASEISTYHARHAQLAAHPAVRDFLEQLEFLHANHARSLRHLVVTLSAESAPPMENSPRGISELPAAALASLEPEEILTATYIRLNQLAALYTRLHTLAVAFARHATAEMSLKHLKAITPKIMECSQALPQVTADDAYRRFGHITPACAELALDATQAAWKNDTHFPDDTSSSPFQE